MTYCLYDARGYVGDLASIHGLQLMSDFAIRVTNEPQIKKFFEEGQAPVTKELVAGFKAIHSSDKNIADTTQCFRKYPTVHVEYGHDK